jgi:spore photoproduct lyase
VTRVDKNSDWMCAVDVPFQPDEIFIEQESTSYPLTGRILERCPDVPVEYVDDVSELIKRYRDDPPAGFNGKHSLLLCRNRGRFLEACPGTGRAYRCCLYLILNTGLGCPLACTYCVLQAYLNNPFLTLFVNRDDMFGELERSARIAHGRFMRIGTGEYMDSLALEHLTGFVPETAEFFQHRPHLMLELKTKTTNVESLLEHDYQDAFIVSWSLNAAEICALEERGTAPLADRILAARALIQKGYRVGFHFDPVIAYSGWEEGYRATVELLKKHIPSESVAWISIGSLRFMPRLKPIAHAAFPNTSIYTGEFVFGLDGKMRYLQEIRLELYASLVGWLREYSKDIFLYYCMESPSVWSQTMGSAPASNWELKKLLDCSLTGCRGTGASRPDRN